ncbi:hypothetical protein ABZ738_10540 [Micromonospora sp. NPDC047793]|uniref:hypothetical protein n=1 Tax=unclassified Micromonospora TaxID=2617518 RepID=UPI0010349B48|nr:hypothetical protein [Verrucosispora sp. SN26_14.1]TBL37574.1 hypothetical protein EYA84_10405 [Verrucosispora sp. SN26_14.1]
MSSSQRRWSAEPPLRLLQVVSGARRRAGQVADRLTQRANHLRRDPVADLPRAACGYLAVLDGRTLHLHALVPAVDIPAPERAALLFVQGERVAATCSATVGTEGDVVSVTARVSFGNGNDEVLLDKGVWSLVLSLSDEFGERRFGLSTGTSSEDDGPTVPSPPHPISGWRYEPTCCHQGLAQLNVAAAKARAEVTRLATGRTDAQIKARLVGVRAVEHPAMVFSPRGGGSDVIVPIDPVDGRFEVTVPLADLVSGPPGVEVIWEAWVRTSPTRMIRLGRFLHDLRDPRSVFRVSRTTVAIGDHHFVGYRPYYTKAGNLAVACLHFTRTAT